MTERVKKVLMGNEAIARGAWEAGCRVAAAYPGTPSTEILETVARQYREIRSQWSPNEKVALEVAAGASLAGARSFAAMKHVGLNVAADPLFTFSYTGVRGGCVIVTADDPGIWSSQNEQDSRHFARAAKIPMLEPADAAEAHAFTKAGFEFSERFDRPVLLRSTTRVSHSRGIVEIGPRTEVPLVPYVRDARKNVMLPAHARARHEVVERVTSEIRAYAEDCPFNRVEMRDRSVGIVTAGVAYRHVREACPDASVLKIGLAWPLPARLFLDFAAAVEKLYVVEELDPFMEEHLRALGIAVTGKDLLPLTGELRPEILEELLNGRKAVPGPAYGGALPGRPPMLCRGCSHGYVFAVLKKLDLTVIGDIGCYTLGTLPPYQAMHAQICMGASVSMHLGFEKALGRGYAEKSVAVIGDSTFIHSGITPLIDMVYNRTTGVVIILDNSTTAMTGHQDHPGTGETLEEEPTFSLDLEAVCRAAGVKRVVVADPYRQDDFEAILRGELAAPETSVIIARRPCILCK